MNEVLTGAGTLRSARPDDLILVDNIAEMLAERVRPRALTLV